MMQMSAPDIFRTVSDMREAVAAESARAESGFGADNGVAA